MLPWGEGSGSYVPEQVLLAEFTGSLGERMNIGLFGSGIVHKASKELAGPSRHMACCPKRRDGRHRSGSLVEVRSRHRRDTPLQGLRKLICSHGHDAKTTNNPPQGSTDSNWESWFHRAFHATHGPATASERAAPGRQARVRTGQPSRGARDKEGLEQDPRQEPLSGGSCRAAFGRG